MVAPSVTVLLIGHPGDRATTLTERSIRATEFDGPIDIIVVGDQSLSEAADRAGGDFLLTVPAGAVLDPSCPAHLVRRMSDTVAVVLPEVRGGDGRPLPTGTHIEPSGFDRPRARHSGVAHRAHHPVDVTAAPTMLIRTGIAAADAIDRLNDSPFGPARAVIELTGRERDVVVEDRAVVYVRPPGGSPARRPGYDLFSGGGLRPNGPSGSEPDAVLWVVAQLPDRTRTGSDARRLEMIESTMAGGADVTVWAERGGDAGPSARRLAAAGADWETPLPTGRWKTTAAAAPFHLLDELLAERTWSAIVVADPRLVAPVSTRAASLAKEAAVIADLGTVRFPAAHGPGAVDVGDPAIESTLEQVAAAHGVVAATNPDARIVGSVQPDRPVFVFSPAGSEPAGGPDRDGHLLFVGDLLHHPNVQALEWWVEEVAGLVHATARRPIRLRVVGNGSQTYRRLWHRPDKVEIAGYMPDLGSELARARVLTVPLPYPTGTGHRIATALRAGVPVVASSAAAAVLPPHLAGLVSVGEDGAELAELITGLMTDDARWEEAWRRVIDSRRVDGAEEWNRWWREQRPPDPDEPVSPRPGIRRGRRRRVRSS